MDHRIILCNIFIMLLYYYYCILLILKHKPAKIFSKRNREQLIEMLNLGGKTIACVQTPLCSEEKKTEKGLIMYGGHVIFPGMCGK